MRAHLGARPWPSHPRLARASPIDRGRDRCPVEGRKARSSVSRMAAVEIAGSGVAPFEEGAVTRERREVGNERRARSARSGGVSAAPGKQVGHFGPMSRAILGRCGSRGSPDSMWRSSKMPGCRRRRRQKDELRVKERLRSCRRSRVSALGSSRHQARAAAMSRGFSRARTEGGRGSRDEGEGLDQCLAQGA